MSKNKKNSNAHAANISVCAETATISNKSIEQKGFNFKKSKRRKLLKTLITIAVIAAVVLFALKSCGTNSVSAYSSYSYETAQRRDMTVSVNGTATIKPNDSYSVTALVKGEILSAPFEDGGTVNKGDLLYSIECEDVETNISMAENSLKSAKLSYNTILENYNNLKIKSVLTGQITDIYFDEGDSISAGALVASITDNSTMLLKLPFHSADASAIEKGMPALVTMSETGEQLNGNVSFVSPIQTSGFGGTLVCEVTIAVQNPGGITENMKASAQVNGISCAEAGVFSCNSKKDVYAKVSGDITKINFDEGDYVQKDQIIIELTSTTLSTQLDSAMLSVSSAELTLKSAKDAIDNYRITAPISGTIVEKNFKEGDTIDSSSLSSSLAVIYDMSELNLKMNIDELYIGQIKVGQKVSITADAVEGKVFTGYVDKININGSTVNGVTSYPVTIVIDDAGELLPGMNVSADIIIEEITDILSIPVSAVSRGNTVLTKLADGEAQDASAPAGYKNVPVTLGRSDGNYIEILSGLEEGDIIAIDTTNTASLMEQMYGSGGPGMSMGM